MAINETLQQELVKDLLLESHEGLDRFDRELLALEQGQTGPDSMNNIFRVIHTLKGTAGCLGLAVARDRRPLRGQRLVWFIHGVRHALELIQAEALRRIARDHPNVRLKICVSDALPEEHAGRDFDHAGRVSVDLLKQLLPANHYVYYACGPGAFMESLTTGLATWGVPKADIRFETFGPSTVKRPASAAAVTLPAGTELTIAFGRAGKPISWDPNCATLLDLAERHGVPVASGCRAGNCGTCLTAIIEGEVDYVHPPGSPPEQGSCLVCIARPKTRLILDV